MLSLIERSQKIPYQRIGFIEIPANEFLPLDWIYRCNKYYSRKWESTSLVLGRSLGTRLGINCHTSLVLGRSLGTRLGINCHTSLVPRLLSSLCRSLGTRLLPHCVWREIVCDCCGYAEPRNGHQIQCHALHFEICDCCGYSIPGNRHQLPCNALNYCEFIY